MRAAAAGIRPVTLELGGKSPMIVFDDADLEAAVEWVMFGIFWNQGQVCSATSRLIVQNGIADRLIQRLVEEARRITIGDGLGAGVLLGPLVSADQRAKVQGFVDRALGQGIELLTGGGPPPGCARGFFFEPTIFHEPPAESEIWTEEVFGPVLAIRRFEDEAAAVRMANDSRFGLAGAVMSRDEARCERVAAAVRAGIIWINCSQPTFTQAPWGGMKQSGIGRELGRWGLENYLETKQITRYDAAKPWGWYLKP